MSYSRKDQIEVRDAYVELLERDDVAASARRAATYSGVDCSATTAKRWLQKEGVLRTRGEAARASWEQKYSDDWERYEVYLKMGYTVAEVAERFDVSTQTVHTAMRRSDEIDGDPDRRKHRRCWDPSTPKGARRQEKVRKMVEMHRKGTPKKEIADKFDISDRHVTTLFRSPLNPFNNVKYDPEESYSR